MSFGAYAVQVNQGVVSSLRGAVGWGGVWRLGVASLPKGSKYHYSRSLVGDWAPKVCTKP